MDKFAFRAFRIASKSSQEPCEGPKWHRKDKSRLVSPFEAFCRALGVSRKGKNGSQQAREPRKRQICLEIGLKVL